MDQFVLNLIHRPELMPEYIQTDADEGKSETLGNTAITSESLDIFRLQQDIAHRNGLKCTIQMTYAALFNEEAVELAKHYHEKYGDEIGHTFLGINCPEFREKFHHKEIGVWLFPPDMKRAIVDDSFEKFKDAFGFYPASTGSYFMDADLLNYIHEKYPGVKAAVSTCFEEGPRVYRHTNNTWYTLMEGSPWGPWIPSKKNTHCIAENEEDDVGIVAIPHLSRDLLAVSDNCPDMFATHPQNIIRGLIYEGDRLPYMYNLVDHYQALKKQNNGYSYTMVYVGPGWMGKTGRWECSYRVLKKSYEDFLAYYGKLKKDGKLWDATMSEFADWYRGNLPVNAPQCALWKDILYGTKNQVFWYADSQLRAQVDLKLGGAITDLRPYCGRLEIPCGGGTAANQDASYPFLVQSRHRGGPFTHYAGEGSIKSAKVRFGGEEVDLSSCRSTGVFSKQDGIKTVTVKPVIVEFSSLHVTIETVIYFMVNRGEIHITRKITGMSDPTAEVEIDEFITACHGTTEYPKDLTGCILSLVEANGTQNDIRYEYRCRTLQADSIHHVEAIVPMTQTRLCLIPQSAGCSGYCEEGYSFAPNLKLGICKKLKLNEEITTCLKVEQEK